MLMFKCFQLSTSQVIMRSFWIIEDSPSMTSMPFDAFGIFVDAFDWILDWLGGSDFLMSQ